MLIASGLTLAALVACVSGAPPTERSGCKSATYDYIVVGGGTAGVAVAARLSEGLPNAKILLIEAGPAVSDEPRINIPGMKGSTLGTKYDWNFTTVPQQHVNNRVLPVNRGRVVGGSSALNLMTYDRAAVAEYNSWEELGNEGWNWKNMIAAMMKSETFTGKNTDTYGSAGVGDSGPVKAVVNREIPVHQESWMPTLNALGIKTNLESLGGNPLGVMYQPSSIDPTIYNRSYSANAYLPIAKPNLRVLSDTTVAKVNLVAAGGGHVATGVTLANGTFIRARAEVIVSAGAVQSPALLEASGIGQAPVLAAAGIAQLIDLPGVGENLQDHLRIMTSYQLKPEFLSFDILRSNATFAAEQLALWNARKKSLYDYTGSGYTFTTWQQAITTSFIQPSAPQPPQTALMQWADTRALRPLVSSIAVARMPPRTPGLPLGLPRPLFRPWLNHRPFHASAMRGSPSRKGKPSIFKEMFPDAGAGHETLRTDRPRRPRDDILAKEPPIQRELLGKDDLRAWLEAQSHGEEEGINARPEKDEMPAMLILSNASKHLAEADFYRIGRKGEHLQGWNTTIKKVIHLHDRNTLAPLDSYFILFTSRAAARAYQREAEQLYSRARVDAAKQDLTPAPPADDMPPFTLAPPSPAPLNLKLYALPPSTAARLGAFTLAKTLPAPEKSVEGAQRVVVSLQGGALPPAAFWGLVRRDGEERNLAWDVLEMQPYFAQKAFSSSASHQNGSIPRDKTKRKKEKQDKAATESTTETQTAEQRAAEETAMTNAPATDDPKGKTHAKSARFVLSFKDVHEARRFARSWHRREFPLSPPRQGRDKGRVGQCVTANVAVPW